MTCTQWQTGVEWCRLCLLWRQTSPCAGFCLMDYTKIQNFRENSDNQISCDAHWIQSYPAHMPVWIQKKKNTVPRERENDVLSQWQTGVEWYRLCLLWRQTSPYAGFCLIDHRCEIEKSLAISENIWDKTLTKSLGKTCSQWVKRGWDAGRT